MSKGNFPYLNKLVLGTENFNCFDLTKVLLLEEVNLELEKAVDYSDWRRLVWDSDWSVEDYRELNFRLERREPTTYQLTVQCSATERRV